MATVKKRVVRTSATPSTKVTIDTGEGLTKQNHKAECDVNLILSRYQKTGVITHRNEYAEQYDDATGMDFQEAMNLVKSAENMFSALPSSIRKRFEQDPAKFLQFVNNPENIDEMIEMGLATKVEPEQPVEVVVKNQTPPETTPEPPQA